MGNSHPANKIVFAPPNYNVSSRELSVTEFRKNKLGKDTPFLFHNNGEKCIVWAHGNACNMYQMLSYVESVANHCNTSFLLFDYQGYGASSDECLESHCYADIECAIDFLLEKNFKKENIYIIGHSIGTGVVVDYVANHEWTTPIILISPYKSILAIGVDLVSSCSSRCASQYFIDYTDTSSKYINIFNSIGKISNVKCPVKIIHGDADTLIPIEHGIRLYENLNDPIELVKLTGAGHNDMLARIDFDHYKNVM